MQSRMLIMLLGAGLVLGCDAGDAREDEAATPAAETAQPAPEAYATAALDLFVDTPPADAQILYVAEADERTEAGRSNGVFVPMSTFSVEQDGIPNEFPPADSMARQLEAAGVRGERFVIVGAPIPAGRAWAALDYLGLGEQAALFEGGASTGDLPSAGAQAGAAEETGATGSAAAEPEGDAEAQRAPQEGAESGRAADAPRTGEGEGRLAVEVRDDRIVDAQWVRQRLSDPSVAILDARPPEQFSGDTPGEGIDRPGHIPGAHNLFWENLVQSPDAPLLKDEAELRRLFEEAGVGPDDTVVAYCRTGGQGSFLYTVARHLGYDARLYDGSYVDWSRTDNPVETGSGDAGAESRGGEGDAGATADSSAQHR